MSLREMHDATAAALVHVAPSSLGEEHIHAHATPPRYVWVPAQRRYRPARKTQGNPRANAEADQLVQVHIWGVDVDQVELLEAALIEALKRPEVLNGMSFELQAGEWLPTSAVTSGRVLVVPILLPQRIPAVVLPTTAPADPLAPVFDAVTSVEVTPTTLTETFDLDPPGGP